MCIPTTLILWFVLIGFYCHLYITDKWKKDFVCIDDLSEKRYCGWIIDTFDIVVVLMHYLNPCTTYQVLRIYNERERVNYLCSQWTVKLQIFNTVVIIKNTSKNICWCIILCLAQIIRRMMTKSWKLALKRLAKRTNCIKKGRCGR